MAADNEKDIVHAGQVRFSYDEKRQIIICFTADNAELTMADARICTEVMKKLTGGIPRPMLGDFTKMKSQTKECRDYFAKDPNHLQTYSAIAIMVSSPISRMLANFFMGLNKPAKPTRLFDERDKAIEWLEMQGKTTG